MDLTVFVIFLTSSFGLWTTTNGYEEGLLVLARAGGRYDPLQIWYGKSRELWATNQCKLDEQDSFRNHCIKGNYRSSRIEELDTYAYVELEIVVFNKHGDELLSVKGCKMRDENITSRGIDCDDPSLPGGKVHGVELDRMGGFVLTSELKDRVWALMFNYGHYFDNDTIGEAVLLHDRTVPTTIPATGYKGCYLNAEKTTKVSEGKMSVEKCVSACKLLLKSNYAALWKGAKCKCLESSTTDKPSHEGNCGSLCDNNVNHICGGEKAYSLYDVREYRDFKKIMDVPQIRLIQEEQINDSRTSIMVKLPGFRLTDVNIEEDPECNLTNLYFNVSSPQYNLTFFEHSDCNGDIVKTMTVFAETTAWALGYIMASCVLIDPVPHNCTFHRSTFQFYAIDTPAASKKFALTPIKESYIGIRGKWSVEPTTTQATTTNEGSSATAQDANTEKGGSSKGTSPSASEKDANGNSANMPASNKANADKTTDSKITSKDSSAGGTTMSKTGTDSGISKAATNKGKDESVETQNSDGSSASPTAQSSTGVDHATSSSDATEATTRTSKGSTESTSPTMTAAPLTTTTPYPTEPDVASNITTPVPAVREACTCLCVEKPRKNQTKVMVAKEKAIKIHKKLKIDTMNLSSSVRRKVSAPDNRITAAVGGYLGICLLTIALGSLILADITSITRHIRLVRNKHPAPPTKGGK